MNPNSFALIQVMKKNGKIFVYFKCKIHNEGLPGENCCFLAFFKTGSKFSACQISSFSDQPFMIFHRQIKKNTPGVFANLNFLNFIACAIVQCGLEWGAQRNLSVTQLFHFCKVNGNFGTNGNDPKTFLIYFCSN